MGVGGRGAGRQWWCFGAISVVSMGRNSRADLLRLTIHCFCYPASTCPSRTIPLPPATNKPLPSRPSTSAKSSLVCPWDSTFDSWMDLWPNHSHWDTGDFFSQTFVGRALSSAPSCQSHPELFRKGEISTEEAKANYHARRPHSSWCCYGAMKRKPGLAGGAMAMGTGTQPCSPFMKCQPSSF